MILQDLIDELSALQPSSARSATVFINDEHDVVNVRYEGGRVIIEVDIEDEAVDEDEDDQS